MLFSPDFLPKDAITWAPADRDMAQSLLEWKAEGRLKQLEPGGLWRVWMLLSGRGFGKTRTAVESVKAYAWKNPGSRTLVAAPTFADARDICFEGESGLVSKIPANCIEDWNRSIGELVLINGSRFDLLSADEPDRVRGRQYHRAWADELASFKGKASGKRDATGGAVAGTPDQMFNQIRLACRLPPDPRILVTTTPRPLKLLKALRLNPRTVVTAGSTYENEANLADAALQDWIELYEGTRLGRQELHAEILEDVEGALWNRMMFDDCRLDPRKEELPRFSRVVIAIDPAVTANKRSSETGIMAVGLTSKGRAVVLQDGSGKYSPDEWATKALSMYDRWSASRIVGESNNGGDMVESTLRAKAPNVSYKHVNASKGKIVRAEPVASLYERKLVDHWGSFPVLEDQCCAYTGEESEDSPDRMDALVWGLTDLLLTTRRSPIVGPVNIDSTTSWTGPGISGIVGESGGPGITHSGWTP